MHNIMTYHPLTNAQPLTKQWSASPSNCPQFIYTAWCSVVKNIPLDSSGQLPWTCSHPANCAPPHWQVHNEDGIRWNSSHKWVCLFPRQSNPDCFPQRIFYIHYRNFIPFHMEVHRSFDWVGPAKLADPLVLINHVAFARCVSQCWKIPPCSASTSWSCGDLTLFLLNKVTFASMSTCVQGQPVSAWVGSLGQCLSLGSEYLQCLFSCHQIQRPSSPLEGTE